MIKEEYRKKYRFYNIAVNGFDNFKRHPKKGSLLLTCLCGSKITLGGCTSHSKTCIHAYKSKLLFLREKFALLEFCLFCGKKNQEDSNIRTLRDHFNFCSGGCAAKAKRFLKWFTSRKKVCPICKEFFISDKKTHKTVFCSVGCYRSHLSKQTKNHWKKTRDTDEYYRRVRLIGIKSREKKGKMPWNFGLSGKEYLKHYQKKDGSNSLYDSIKRNSSFFRKTLPEKKMEDILLSLSLKFEHPFFRKRKQFDFVIFLKNYRFIIEVDGDYWHKSSRRCSDPTIRRNQRDIDKRKEGVFKKIKSNKSWVVLRFWELDILNDSITVEKYIKELIKEDKKGNCESTIQKIKKYYRKKS